MAIWPLLILKGEEKMETIVEIAKIITAVGVIATFMWNIFMQFMKFKMYLVFGI